MIRIDNASEILRAVHVNGSMTRTALANLTGLNRSTVGTHLHELAAAGLITQSDGLAGQVGRPSQIAAPRAEGAVVWACDVRVDYMTFAIVGLGGQVLHRETHAHESHRSDPGNTCQRIVDRMQAALTEVGITHGQLKAVGVALPGLVDRHDGVLRYAPNLGWFDVPFAAMLQDGLRGVGLGEVPIAVRNDADAGALAERTRGAARGVTSAVYLSGGVGIGAGIVLGGRRILDAGGFSGEIGHMIVNPQGRVCDCGARGCWETEISERRLTSPAARVEVLEWLDLGLRNVVNLLNPDVVVLGDHLREFVDALRTRQRGSDRLAAWEQVAIVPAALGGESTMIGVAEAAFDPFLSEPLR